MENQKEINTLCMKLTKIKKVEFLKEAGYGQRLDKEILQKIKELAMKEGITNATEMKSHIALFVKSKYRHIPKSNRRFHPTTQDLRFHISSALKSNM